MAMSVRGVLSRQMKTLSLLVHNASTIISYLNGCLIVLVGGVVRTEVADAEVSS